MNSHKNIKYVSSVLEKLNKDLITNKYSTKTIRETKMLLEQLKRKLTNKVGGSPLPSNFELLPPELRIGIMKNLTPGDIKQLCSVNTNIQAFCNNKDNWKDIQRSIIKRLGPNVSNEDIPKIYSIIEKIDPFLKGRDELLAYALLTDDEKIINFFKDYFFSFGSNKYFTDEDIEYISDIIREYILNNNFLSKPKTIKITHNGKTIKFLSKENDVFLFSAIKNGNMSVAIDLLDKYRNDGTPVFRMIPDCINYANTNYNTIKELLEYFSDYDSDYFTFLDDTEHEFLSDIKNIKARDFVRQWLQKYDLYRSENTDQDTDEESYD